MSVIQALHSIPPLETMPAWLLNLGVFFAILLVAMAVQYLLMPLVRRRAETWNPLLKHVFVKTQTIARVAFVLLAVNFSLPVVPLPADTIGDMRRVLGAAAIVLMGWMILIATNLAADRYIGGFRLDVSDNLDARKAVTQARVLKRTVGVIIAVITVALALMTFDAVREVGVSIFASAGVAGILVGLAAQQFLANLLAGIQLAITQPLRLEDVVVIDGEFGWVEEIKSTYVVIRLWDWRRMVVPIKHLFDTPFQNWTRQSSAILSNFHLYMDYAAPVEILRKKAIECAEHSKNWNHGVVNLQVTDFKEHVMELRVLLSADDAGKAWDVRADVREELISFIQSEIPYALPRRRNENSVIAEISETPEGRRPTLRTVSNDSPAAPTGK